VPSIDSLKFDTAGWTLKETSSEVMCWTNPKAQVLSLHFFNKPPDIPCALMDLDTLRAMYRLGLSQSGAALISGDVSSANHLKCVKVVFKTPRQPRGMVYVGSLTFPFQEFSYVAKIQCVEPGSTGLRDAVVFQELSQRGTLEFDNETRSFRGWAAGPYDPTYKAPLLRNRSDDEQFDASFPDHPLTDVRIWMNTMPSTVHADESVLAAAGFGGAEVQAAGRDEVAHGKKPWWRFW